MVSDDPAKTPVSGEQTTIFDDPEIKNPTTFPKIPEIKTAFDNQAQTGGEPSPVGKTPLDSSKATETKNQSISDLTLPSVTKERLKQIDELKKQREALDQQAIDQGDLVTASYKRQQDLITQGVKQKEDYMKQYGSLKDQYKAEMLQNASEMRSIRRVATEQGRRRLNELNNIVDKIQNFKAEVDPNLFWKKKSARSKALIFNWLAASAGVGAFNSTIGFLNSEIERELGAQKFNAQTELQALTSSYSAKLNLYSEFKKLTDDDVAAEEAVRATFKEAMATEYQKLAFMVDQDDKKTNLLVASEKLTQDALVHKQELAKSLSEKISNSIQDEWKRLSAEQKAQQENLKEIIKAQQFQATEEGKNIRHQETLQAKKEEFEAQEEKELRGLRSHISEYDPDEIEVTNKYREGGDAEKIRDEYVGKSELRSNIQSVVQNSPKGKPSKENLEKLRTLAKEKGVTGEKFETLVEVERIKATDKRLYTFRNKDKEKAYTANSQSRTELVSNLTEVKGAVRSLLKQGILTRAGSSVMSFATDTKHSALKNLVKQIESILIGKSRVAIVGPGPLIAPEIEIIKNALGMGGATAKFTKASVNKFEAAVDRVIKLTEDTNQKEFARGVHGGTNRFYMQNIYNPALNHEFNQAKEEGTQRFNQFVTALEGRP